MGDRSDKTTSGDNLFRLQSEVVDFGSRSPSSDAELPPSVAARDWGRLFASLGTELKRHGYSRQLSEVTIALPADGDAIDALRIACSVGSQSEDSDDFQSLLARLNSVLSDEPKKRERFVSSLRSVLERLTMFHR